LSGPARNPRKKTEATGFLRQEVAETLESEHEQVYNTVIHQNLDERSGRRGWRLRGKAKSMYATRYDPRQFYDESDDDEQKVAQCLEPTQCIGILCACYRR
jgi:hypothetical protein